MTALARYKSPVGTLSVEATDDGVCSVRFGGRDGARPPISKKTRHNLEAGLQALADYFSGHTPFVPPLDLHGTEHQRIVWKALLEIPWGETITYGELAGRIGSRGARAVGNANGHNPVAILVPCHRVVATGGGLGGYSGGLDVKRWLLAHETAHGPVLRAPRRA
ncbi:MAG: methylated-DNA--[protein]-cysteine S-methyltransferase [Deltaproteobacteria bacterium]